MCSNVSQANGAGSYCEVQQPSDRCNLFWDIDRKCDEEDLSRAPAFEEGYEGLVPAGAWGYLTNRFTA
jgi:hypothetical protein